MESQVTVDVLVGKLREVRKVKNDKRLFKSIIGDFIEQDGIKIIDILEIKNKGMPNNVHGILNYYNKHLHLGIEYLPIHKQSEDSKATILWDLCHFPRAQVLERLKKEGAIICD